MAPVADAERHVEERVARLESDVGHIRADISDIKLERRGLTGRLDGLRDKVEDLRVEMHDSLSAIRQPVDKAKIWGLLMGAAILGVLARGFHWI